MSKNVPLAGILMMVAGGLNAVLCVFLGIAYLAIPSVADSLNKMPGGGMGGRGSGGDPKMVMAVVSVMFFFWAILNVVYLVAGNSVRTWGNRTFGLVMAIVGLVPCLSGHPCCNYILTLASGIFALVVLLNAETKAAWDSKGAAAPPPPAA